jgi:hypothetical protein
MEFRNSNYDTNRTLSPSKSSAKRFASKKATRDDPPLSIGTPKRSNKGRRLPSDITIGICIVGALFLAFIWQLNTSIVVRTNTDIVNSNLRVGRLRFDWTNLPVQSPIAKQMVHHQTNCSLPLGNYNWRKKMFGLGSDLHVWGAALCNGVEAGLRIRTRNLYPWVWLDAESCPADKSEQSTMSCYFPQVELQCPNDQRQVLVDQTTIGSSISNPIRSFCNKTAHSPLRMHNKTDWRAAGIEMLFSHVSPLVQKEAERQLRRVFPPHGIVPENLITVHMRWGDKKYENKIVKEKETLEAIARIRKARGDNLHERVPILLCTENPKAVAAFRWIAPLNYQIYVDQFYYEMLPHRPKDDAVYNLVPKMARSLQGKTGLWALGSLLVAMEADAFVLVLSSHWSRLMNELRKNVLDPRCKSCTLMEDAAKGEWTEW